MRSNVVWKNPKIENDFGFGAFPAPCDFRNEKDNRVRMIHISFTQKCLWQSVSFWKWTPATSICMPWKVPWHPYSWSAAEDKFLMFWCWIWGLYIGVMKKTLVKDSSWAAHFQGKFSGSMGHQPFFSKQDQWNRRPRSKWWPFVFPFPSQTRIAEDSSKSVFCLKVQTLWN